MTRCGNRRPRNPTTWGASTYTFKQYFALLGLATHASRALDQPISLRQPGQWRMGPHADAELPGFGRDHFGATRFARRRTRTAQWNGAARAMRSMACASSLPHDLGCVSVPPKPPPAAAAFLVFLQGEDFRGAVLLLVRAGTALPEVSPFLVELTSVNFHLPGLRSLASHRMRPGRVVRLLPGFCGWATLFRRCGSSRAHSSSDGSRLPTPTGTTRTQVRDSTHRTGPSPRCR